MDRTTDPINGKKKTIADDQECCANCDHAEFPPGANGTGTCHANPPQMLLVPQQNQLTGGVSMAFQTVFPIVEADTWCHCFDPAMGDPHQVPEKH